MSNILGHKNLKAVILAGGYGTRISEESGVRPKPMVEIGGKPILWHIMKIYSAFGIKDFIIACGYKSNVIKDYFANYYLYSSDVTFNLRTNSVLFHNNGSDDWNVTLVETGENSTKSTRIKLVAPYVGNQEFLMTYGDGVANIDVDKLMQLHKSENALVTLTAVQPPGRFGGFVLKEGQRKITSFKEKPVGDGAWINGGFFVVSPQAIDYIVNESIDWEDGALPQLAKEGKLAAYAHEGFWHPMDTLRDKNVLEKIWQEGRAPWKVW